MRIDHVGVAVASIAEAADFYCRAFGLRVLHEEEVPSQRVRVAFLGETGAEAQVELLEPIGKEGAVARFLAERGPGMHHLAFRSPALESDMARLREQGRPALEDRPRPGARGHSVCFLHPKHGMGTLIELVG